VPDIPAEAMEAAGLTPEWQRRATYDAYHAARAEGDRIGYPFLDDRIVLAALRAYNAAALPHLRERWLAEVEGALRDAHWYGERPLGGEYRAAADYLRDVLGAEVTQ
jgi:hypothetical protein